MITYDLNLPGQEYKPLYEAIRKLAEYDFIHPLESGWFSVYPGTAKDIYTCLKSFIDENDDIIVCQMTKDYSGVLQNGSDADWLKARI
jgi:pyruvate/2-oxoglutarate/acetoin dehydrogenase E1 component